jgi:hypothetical protein
LSDTAQIIVDIEVDAARAPALAGMVRAWLVSEEIVEREQSDFVRDGVVPEGVVLRPAH